MAITASVGYAQALSGREAGLQATHQALNRLGSGSPGFGFVVASHQYQAREVVSGVSSLLGDTPMIGFSSPVCLAGDGLHPNAVMVGLLAGDFQAETRWMPGYAQSGRETGAQLSKQLADQADTRGLLFFADGFNGDADQLCTALSSGSVPLAGGLSSGDLHTGHSYQIAGPQNGTGALTAAFLPVSGDPLARVLAPHPGRSPRLRNLCSALWLPCTRVGLPAPQPPGAFVSARRGTGRATRHPRPDPGGGRRQLPDERPRT
jgi:hypothetical protein